MTMLNPTRRRNGQHMATVRFEVHLFLDDVANILAEQLMSRLLDAYLADDTYDFTVEPAYDVHGANITAKEIETRLRDKIRMYGDSWLESTDAIFGEVGERVEKPVKAWAQKRIRVLFPDWPT